MKDLITGLIRSSQGHSHETAGVLIGFFNTPEQARRCADEIIAMAGKAVEVCGCRLSIL
jgi:hypothetical protein